MILACITGLFWNTALRAAPIDDTPLAPALPRILSDDDAAFYSRIFRLQDTGKWKEADRLLAKLENRILVGHVLFQRYMHPTRYRSRFAELRDWLERYADHPEAFRIYALAIKRKSKKTPDPKVPVFGEEHISHLLGEKRKRRTEASKRAQKATATVSKQIRAGNPTKAAALLRSPAIKSALSTLKIDEIRGDVAMGYFIKGLDGEAYQTATEAAERSGLDITMAHWVAGLAAYRQGWFSDAAKHFERHARSKRSSDWNVSGGAYWAARMHLTRGDHSLVTPWLRVAAEKPYTFYGILARRALGLPPPFNWAKPLLTRGDIERVIALSGGKRALALVEAGQARLADSELMPHIRSSDVRLTRSVVAVSDALGLPQTSVRGAYRLAGFGAAFRDRALYPVPPWNPGDGYEVDRALIYAFTRQESLFNPRATSHAGARGLMQLMPRTASYIAEGSKPFKGRKRDLLYNPELNLALGQDYLQYLLKKNIIGLDLFRLAIGYNAGVGNLARWIKTVRHNNDPLLFIEALPSRETRIFIERVLANLWIYRQRLGQQTPSLENVAAGNWPIYQRVETNGVQIAEDARQN